MMPSKQDCRFNDGFLHYIQNKLVVLRQHLKTDHQLQHMALLSTKKEIQLFENMKVHYEIAKKQFESQLCIDPAQNGNPSVFRQNNGSLAQILVYGSLINQQTFFKHQMISINQAMFEQFDCIKTKILDPLLGIEDEEHITIQQTIRKVNVQINRILDNKKLNIYLRQLDCLKSKLLSDSKEQVVIQQYSQEQQKEQKQQILKINNSSSQSYKGKKIMIQNYEGDEQVFTGDSDHKIHQKKNLSKKLMGKKKNPKKKYVEQQNYYASQQEQKHKKKAINWRYHTNQQGFDTDKEKITDDKK